MYFQWPSALILLVTIPLLLAFYFWRRNRKRRFAIRFSSLSLVRAAVPAQSRLRRYLPLALFCLALTSLVISLARPVSATLVPEGRATVMLTLDVSRSMLQNDIPPSRLGAAKEAALSFIRRQKDTNLIGIVAFASFAQLVQPPTNDLEELETAILLLSAGRGTNLGSGILTGLDAIAEFNQSGATPAAGGATATLAVRKPGDYEPDIIVLLSDGVPTTGPHPLEAAKIAVERGVRVYTIGYGTKTGSTIPGNDYFGGGWSFRRRGIDEEMLKEIAAMTGGQYYTANSASELQRVFDRLPTFLVTRKETVEISVAFAAIAALLIASAVLLVQLWRPLP